jgi:hypothetical protein
MAVVVVRIVLAIAVVAIMLPDRTAGSREKREGSESFMAPQGFDPELFKDLTWRRIQLLRFFADGAQRIVGREGNGNRAQHGAQPR